MRTELTKERIQEMKDLLEKEHEREFTWEEASDAAYRLAGLVDICFDSWKEDCRRKKKLEESPKGFHLDGVGYTCLICGNSCSNEESWYDKWGIKCLVCQKAIDKNIIPISCAKFKDRWYSKYDLESRFNIKYHALKRLMKEGVLSPRIVLNSTGKPHTYLFLIKDHKDTLPPKKLTESKMIKETKDGKDWYHSEPWYRFVDPHKHLKEYKIMDYLQVIKEENAK